MRPRFPSLRWLALPFCALVLGLSVHATSTPAEARCLPVAPDLLGCTQYVAPYARAYVTAPQGVYEYDYFLDGSVTAHFVRPALAIPYPW